MDMAYLDWGQQNIICVAVVKNLVVNAVDGRQINERHPSATLHYKRFFVGLN